MADDTHFETRLRRPPDPFLELHHELGDLAHLYDLQCGAFGRRKQLRTKDGVTETVDGIQHPDGKRADDAVGRETRGVLVGADADTVAVSLDLPDFLAIKDRARRLARLGARELIHNRFG